MADCQRATGGRHPGEIVRAHLAFHLPRIAALPDEERAEAVHAVTVQAHDEIAELIAAQAINDAIESDAIKRATKNR